MTLSFQEKQTHHANISPGVYITFQNILNVL